jgi:hypothetical protein
VAKRSYADAFPDFLMGNYNKRPAGRHMYRSVPTRMRKDVRPMLDIDAMKDFEMMEEVFVKN